MIFIYVCDMVSLRRKEHFETEEVYCQMRQGSWNLSALLFWISTLLKSGSQNCELPKR